MIIIASAVLVAILAIVGVAYYSSADAKYRRMTIIEVDDIVNTLTDKLIDLKVIK